MWVEIDADHPGTRLAEVTSDMSDEDNIFEDDVFTVDAFDEESDGEEFQDPSAYRSDPKKLKEYGLEDDFPIPAPLPFTRTKRGKKAQ